MRPARALRSAPRTARLAVPHCWAVSAAHETGLWLGLAVPREATTSPGTRDTQGRPAGPKPRLWEQLARRIPEVDAGALVGT
jgi:hypothetical protein